MKKPIAEPAFAAVLFCLIAFSITAYCQPNIQKASLRAPAAINIDGKTSEWPGNKLQAYNNTDDIWYTVCNDDNNLYLTIRAPYRFAADKILQGDITLTISHTIGKNREKNADNIAVSFPYFDKEDRLSITSTLLKYETIKKDTIHKIKEHDSIYTFANYNAAHAFKLIKIAGAKKPDTLISVYNNDGIKTMGQFNRQMDFTCELAISLKYLGLSVSNADKFSYNIKLNGLPPVKMYNKFGHEISSMTETVYVPGSGNVNPNDLYRTQPTDFWGEYALAKK